jgi:predicted branched-subunit amino acid permease
MFPAAFLALLAPQLRRPGAPVAAVTGVVIALALVPFAPAGVPVLAALAGVVPGVLAATGVRP